MYKVYLYFFIDSVCNRSSLRHVASFASPLEALDYVHLNRSSVFRIVGPDRRVAYDARLKHVSLFFLKRLTTQVVLFGHSRFDSAFVDDIQRTYKVI